MPAKVTGDELELTHAEAAGLLRRGLRARLGSYSPCRSPGTSTSPELAYVGAAGIAWAELQIARVGAAPPFLCARLGHIC